MQQQEILDPHRLLCHLFSVTGISIAGEDVSRFWHHVRTTAPQDCYVSSPASEHHIPVSIYGDSAKLSQSGGKMLAIYLGLPLWRPRSTRCARWCIWACEEDVLFKHHTLNRIMKRITWSLNLAFEGVGGHQFILTEFKGDWLYAKTVLRFRSSWKRLDNVCWRCRAGCPGNSSWYECDQPHWEEYSFAVFLAEQMTGPDT